ncbi:MAG: hypothetical protein EB127_31190, partial [Alphaproteobacteria bacterium]|nr:hypothetical protein [Alphaproteobacteria bacterium]
ESVELIGEITYLDVDKRAELLSNLHAEYIQNIQKSALSFGERKMVNIDLEFSFISKGFILETAVSEIQRLTLFFDDEMRYDYDNIDLKLMGRYIGEGLLFIPFKRNANWQDRSIESYIGAPNLGRISKIHLKIQYSTPQTEICIHDVASNCLIIVHGSAHLRYGGNTKIRLSDGLWTTASKSINPDKAFCPIKYSQIENGDTFCECSKCKNCFSADELIATFATLEKNCPLCRELWENWVVYTAVNEPNKPT